MTLRQLVGLAIVGIALSLTHNAPVFADGGDTTLIHGCVAKDGTTRIVSATTACKNNETPRHWPTDARIIADETRITNTETTNTNQNTAITAIQTKNTQQDADIAALQGQVGGGSGLVVKDSLGQVVGKVWDLASLGFVTLFRQIGNTPTLIRVFPDRFHVGGVSFVYTASDSTGTRYIQSAVTQGSFFTEELQTTDGQTFYFATLPGQFLVVQSTENFGFGEDPLGVGQFFNFGGPEPFVTGVGTPSTVSAASLGTPPFRLE
jgi:hypothetical protein